jgi:hypothetical protein
MELSFKIDLDVPITDRYDRFQGMTKVVREMPVNSSILFSTQAEAISCVNILVQNHYAAARRKRTIEKHGEEGWRVWKLGDKV